MLLKKKKKSEEISCFDVLIIIYAGLGASPVA
jgi:hypothetical protein